MAGVRPAGLRQVLAPAALGLLVACARSGEGTGDRMPGDSLENRPGSAAGACLVDTLAPSRLDVAARWDDGHVRVSGSVRGGAGNMLNVRLAHGARFVYDEVFRGERIGAVALTSDGVDLVSSAYAPAAGELEAFRRVGAVPRDPALPLCLDLSLYELRTLDRLASRQILLPSSP